MGFTIAQARLGPGRIHHCMRAIGAAERALALMTARARTRVFGTPLSQQGMVQQQIALSRNEIDQARLLCQKAAWAIDQYGNKEARTLVAQIRAVAPQMACNVIDRAIQIHGAAGSVTTSLWPGCTAGSAPCASSMGRTSPYANHARAELGREKSDLAQTVVP
jgi:acyl-CoA dehydrogenase